jgi:hypothetical protein
LKPLFLGDWDCQRGFAPIAIKSNHRSNVLFHALLEKPGISKALITFCFLASAGNLAIKL